MKTKNQKKTKKLNQVDDFYKKFYKEGNINVFLGFFLQK